MKEYNFWNYNFQFELHEKSELTSNLIRQYGCSVDMECVYAYTKFLNKEDIYVDLGANIGWELMFAAQMTNQCIAVEPDKDNATLLRKNLDANQMNNVIVAECAVSDSIGKAQLFSSNDNFGNHILNPMYISEEHDSHYEVPVETLDSLFAQLNVDQSKIKLIKMDIQGSESYALNGGKEFFSKYRPKIIFEYSPFHLKQCGSSPFDILSFIDKYDYRPFFFTKIDIVNPVFNMVPLDFLEIVKETPRLLEQASYENFCLIHSSELV